MKALVTAFALVSFLAAGTVPYAAQAEEPGTPAPAMQTPPAVHQVAPKHVTKMKHKKVIHHAVHHTKAKKKSMKTMHPPA